MSIRSSRVTRPAAVLLFGGAVACAGSADAGFINRTNSSAYLEMGSSSAGIYGNLPSNWFGSNSTYTLGSTILPDKLVFTSSSDACSVVKQNGSTGRIIINTLVLQFGVDAATSLTVTLGSGMPNTVASLSEVGGATLATWGGASGGSGTFSVTTGKTYRFQLYCDEYSGSFFSGNVLGLQLAPVPAPGAVALLAVAGLAPRRRRR